MKHFHSLIPFQLGALCGERAAGLKKEFPGSNLAEISRFNRTLELAADTAPLGGERVVNLDRHLVESDGSFRLPGRTRSPQPLPSEL